MADKYHIRYTSQECLESILSIGQGEPISAKKYDTVIPRGLFPTSRTIIDKFGSWKRALNLAGFYPEERYCLECRKKFEVFQRHKDQRFCSDICRPRYYRRNFPEKVRQQLRESFYKRRKTERYKPNKTTERYAHLSSDYGKDTIESLGRRINKTNDTLMTPKPKETAEIEFLESRKIEKPII